MVTSPIVERSPFQQFCRRRLSFVFSMFNPCAVPEDALLGLDVSSSSECKRILCIMASGCALQLTHTAIVLPLLMMQVFPWTVQRRHLRFRLVCPSELMMPPCSLLLNKPEVLLTCLLLNMCLVIWSLSSRSFGSIT